MTNKFIYAGFWLRFVAYIIDAIAIIISAGVLSVLIPFIDPNFVRFIVAGAYFIYLESSQYQATLGKMALGLKVTDLNGKRIIPSVAVIRFIGKIISGVIFFIGFIMAAFTDKKQALHDIIASTLVVQSASLQAVEIKTESQTDGEVKIVDLPVIAQ